MSLEFIKNFAISLTSLLAICSKISLQMFAVILFGNFWSSSFEIFFTNTLIDNWFGNSFPNFLWNFIKSFFENFSDKFFGNWLAYLSEKAFAISSRIILAFFWSFVRSLENVLGSFFWNFVCKMSTFPTVIILKTLSAIWNRNSWIFKNIFGEIFK